MGTATIMITNLVHSKLGTNHPMAQQIIDKYSPEAETVTFSTNLEDMDKFRRILSDVQDEMKELGTLGPR